MNQDEFTDAVEQAVADAVKESGFTCGPLWPRLFALRTAEEYFRPDAGYGEPESVTASIRDRRVHLEVKVVSEPISIQGTISRTGGGYNGSHH